MDARRGRRRGRRGRVRAVSTARRERDASAVDDAVGGGRGIGGAPERVRGGFETRFPSSGAREEGRNCRRAFARRRERSETRAAGRRCSCDGIECERIR